jgi:hypothetical protein
MSQDSEKIRRLVEFKGKVEQRIRKLEAELEDLQATLETVNSILLEKGFKRADAAREASAVGPIPVEKEIMIEPEEPSRESGASPENVVPLKTTAGELLGVLYVNKDSLRALPATDKNFEINTPPFTHFLVERVLMKMQERDNELIRAGQLSPDCALSYNVIREGDLIREISVKNVDSERMKELKSSIRWTLEKMHEKTKTQN